MDCRPPCLKGTSSSSSDDSREIRRSDVVANGVVLFGLIITYVVETTNIWIGTDGER